MNYAGQDIKFKVTSSFENFSLSENDFSITVKNSWGRVTAKVPKDECFRDSEGNFYFTLECVNEGAYEAIFRGSVPDNDYIKMTATIVDRQWLVTVGHCDCRVSHHASRCGCPDHNVHYEQIWTVNLDNETYLADKDGNIILTADGRRIVITE